MNRGSQAVPDASCTGVRGIDTTATTVRAAVTPTARKTADAAEMTVAVSGTRSPDAAKIPFATAPKIATPTALPIERENRLAPVTTPRSFHPTLDCAAISDGVATRPRPRPATKQLAATRAVSYTHLRAHETDSYLVCR